MSSLCCVIWWVSVNICTRRLSKTTILTNFEALLPQRPKHHVVVASYFSIRFLLRPLSVWEVNGCDGKGDTHHLEVFLAPSVSVKIDSIFLKRLRADSTNPIPARAELHLMWTLHTFLMARSTPTNFRGHGIGKSSKRNEYIMGISTEQTAQKHFSFRLGRLICYN